MNWHRVYALLQKEFADLVRNRTAFVPVLIVAAVSLVLPFIIALVVPMTVGQPLSADVDFTRAVFAASRYSPPLRALSGEASVQAFLFQQFLFFFLLIPVTGSMSLAAHSVVGEKQARTLEPLLATPVSTAELLTAKVLGAALPTLTVMVTAFNLYLFGIAFLARRGVFAAIATSRSFGIVLLLGPLAALVALQMAVIVSSKVNDPRTAQQVGLLLIVPVVGVLVAQFAGLFWLTLTHIFLASIALLIAFVLLTLFGVAIFEREAVLTKWR